MKAAVLALLALTASAMSQGHNGTKAWEVGQFRGVVPMPRHTYLVFQEGSRAEVVPMESVMLVGTQVVVKSRHPLYGQGGGWVNNPTLFTHADLDLYTSCLEELFGVPTIASMASEVDTYYVCVLGMVRHVKTQRRANEAASAWIKRHAYELKEMLIAFPMDKAATDRWREAKDRPHGGTR